MSTQTFLGLTARAIGLSLAFLASCAGPTLDLSYAYRLEQADRESPLSFHDENFAFTFTAIESGVHFKVENLSSTAAHIDWSNSYFSEPDGNTFNALNTDILNESDEVASRTAAVSAHRTQLPAGATVLRFTTSTVNAEEDDLVTVKEIGAMLSTTNVLYKPSQGWGWSHVAQATTSRGFARSLSVSKSDSWFARRFWQSTVKVGSGMKTDSKELLALSENYRRNPGYTLGLRIQLGDELRDYKFRFLIDSVFASRTERMEDFEEPGPDGSYIKQALKLYARADGDWAWKHPEDKH